MVDWGNPQDVLDISYSIMNSVSTFQQSPRVQNRQPLDENPHYRRLDGEKADTLLDNLCDSTTCPLCHEIEDGCEYLYLESYDIGSFIATLEADNENPYKWD
jgi:hypothetical protein